MLAVLLGVSGMGVYSQFTNLVSLLNFVVPLGLPFSLTKFISEKENIPEEERNKLLSGSLMVIIASSILVSLTLIVFASEISYLLTNSHDYRDLVIIISILIPFSFIVSLFEALVRGLRKLNLLTKLLMTASVVSTVIAIVFVWIWGLAGAVTSIAAGSVAMLIIYAFVFGKAGLLRFSKSSFSVDKKLITGYFKLGLASLAIGAINQISYLAVRTIAIDNLGISANGIYQSVLGISLNYFTLIFVLISNYTLPKLNAYRDDGDFRKEINETFRIFNFALTPLVCALIVCRFLIVTVLYSDDFLAATALYKYQFPGDFFKVLAWISGLWIIPKNKIRLWLSLELITFTLYPLLSFILLNKFGMSLEAISVSYLVSNVLHFLMNVYFLRRNIRFSLTSQNLKMFLMSILLIPLIIVISEQSPLAGYFAIVPILAIWFMAVADKEEKSMLWRLIRRGTA
ncbi:MAG: oligosaccharide flippase family protein [Ignavibacteria bacterium]|nr:oligosaccharide flippase family protein [Ignavibacteria bacterium]